MAKSVRISDDLYALAQTTSQALGRSTAQQMEYWARLGAALDAAGISTTWAIELLGRGGDADEFVAVALGRVVPELGGLPMLKERQRKDAAEVAAGRRTQQSLLLFGKGDLKGARIIKNPKSGFAQPGTDRTNRT